MYNILFGKIDALLGSVCLLCVDLVMLIQSKKNVRIWKIDNFQRQILNMAGIRYNGKKFGIELSDIFKNLKHIIKHQEKGHLFILRQEKEEKYSKQKRYLVLEEDGTIQTRLETELKDTYLLTNWKPFSSRKPIYKPLVEYIRGQYEEDELERCSNCSSPKKVNEICVFCEVIIDIDDVSNVIDEFYGPDPRKKRKKKKKNELNNNNNIDNDVESEFSEDDDDPEYFPTPPLNKRRRKR